jgi:hypothetical protein
VADRKVETGDRGWPNLFVVGAARAGTTSLWRYLHAHPEIFMAPVKEPCFFAKNPVIPLIDAETYLGLFSGARSAQFRGEASTTYLHGEDAPEAIREVSPDARIVISLREPVEQCHANYLLWHRLRRDPRSFRQAIREEVLEGKQSPFLPRDQGATYTGAATYTEAVNRYLGNFGERVFVLFFEDLVADTRSAVRELFQFLALDPSPADRLDPKPHNQFGRARNPLARRVLRSGRAFWVARAVVPRSWRDPIFRALAPPAVKPEPNPETVDLLTEAFEPDVLALRDLMERRLPDAWERRFPSAAPSPVET